jgi:plastocyanin
MKTKSLAICATLFLAIGVAGSALAGGSETVAIDNFTFAPRDLRVKVGTKVTFVNRDDIPHNVVDKAGAFHSAALDTGESYAFQFDKPGEIVYFCGLHPQMTGKITVVP